MASGGSGQPVHAGSDLRRRAIVLDSALRGGEFRRILIHELFHFVWRRLGNPARREWEAVLVREFERRARGELGWAAESRKLQLTPEARAARSPSWRAYACEAFCETAAWLWCGSARHQEFTLAARHCEARRQWFRNRMAGGRIQL